MDELATDIDVYERFYKALLGEALRHGGSPCEPPP